MTTILTKKELAEILLVDGQNFRNIKHAIEELGVYFDKIIKRQLSKPDSYFIRAFRNRGYEISLLFSSDNSKFKLS